MTERTRPHSFHLEIIDIKIVILSHDKPKISILIIFGVGYVFKICYCNDITMFDYKRSQFEAAVFNQEWFVPSPSTTLMKGLIKIKFRVIHKN